MKDNSLIEDFNYVVNTIKSTHPSSVSGLPYDFNEYASLSAIEIHNVELFKGKIICLVSNKTFSSARIFATVLKDNNIAKIVGEPTGGKPCSYGNPLRFKTPNYNIKFRVSSRIFTRPVHSCEDDIALFPDVLIYPTIEDVLNGHDVVLNEAISMFTNS